MPFGLNNASPKFEQLMKNILRGKIGKTSLLYFGDVYCFVAIMPFGLNNAPTTDGKSSTWKHCKGMSALLG